MTRTAFLFIGFGFCTLASSLPQDNQIVTRAECGTFSHSCFQILDFFSVLSSGHCLLTQFLLIWLPESTTGVFFFLFAVPFLTVLVKTKPPHLPDGFPTKGSCKLNILRPIERNKNTAARHTVRQPFAVNSIMAVLCVKGCNVRDKRSAAAAAAVQINSCVGGKKEEGGGEEVSKMNCPIQRRNKRKANPPAASRPDFMSSVTTCRVTAASAG